MKALLAFPGILCKTFFFVTRSAGDSFNDSPAARPDMSLVYRLAYNGDVAAGQLAVFQGASEAPISGSIRAERATRKNSQLAAARRVALKMGRRLRCSSVAYRFRYAPSSASPARTPLPTAHFERNDVIIIY